MGGGGRNRRANRYQLTIPDDALTRLDLLEPTERTPDTQMSSVSNRTPDTQMSGDDVGNSGQLGLELRTSDVELRTPVTGTPDTQMSAYQGRPPIDTNDQEARVPRCPNGRPYSIDGECCGQPHDLSGVI